MYSARSPSHKRLDASLFGVTDGSCCAHLVYLHLMQEALWRVEAFADEGADIVFIDALETREEMQAFCSSARLVPKV